jgi:hypothetical protein
MTLGTFLKYVDFFFNPFWEFMNYRRIRSNGKRVSDFYDLTKVNLEPDVSIVLDKADIPVADGKLSKIKRTHKGVL